MSLWSVDDDGTKELMVEYYRRIQNGEAKGEALRQVQLEMLQNPERQHPFYWAAFIPSGAWSPLNSGS
jgi:CHAT domain-containing protein